MADYYKYLDEVETFLVFGVGNKKAKLLGVSNDKKTALKNAMNTLKGFVKEGYDESTFIGQIIELVIIEESAENWSREKNKLLPGPIVMTILDYKIKPGFKVHEVGRGYNNQIFFTPEYLKKDGIEVGDINQGVVLYVKGQLKKNLMENNIFTIDRNNKKCINLDEYKYAKHKLD